MTLLADVPLNAMPLSIHTKVSLIALTAQIYIITRGRAAKRNDTVNNHERNAKRIDHANTHHYKRTYR